MPSNPLKKFHQSLLDKEGTRKEKMKSLGNRLKFWKGGDKEQENKKSGEDLPNDNISSGDRATLEQAKDFYILTDIFKEIPLLFSYKSIL